MAATLLGDGHVGKPADVGDPFFGFLNGLYWLTVNLADRGPLLMSVDDAHLSDAPSLRFLAYLSRRLEGLPVLLVAAGRSPDPEGEDLWRQLAEDPVAEVIRRDGLEHAGDALLKSGRALVVEYTRHGPGSLWREAARVTAPTLVIHGDADRILPITASGVRTAKLIKGARLVVVKGGPHCITWTHADEVNSELVDFLR